jgi:hypothetical protein
MRIPEYEGESPSGGATDKLDTGSEEEDKSSGRSPRRFYIVYRATGAKQDLARCRGVSIVPFLAVVQDKRRSSEPLTRKDCPFPPAVDHSLNEAIQESADNAVGVSAPVVLRLPPGHSQNYGFLLAHLTKGLWIVAKPLLCSSWSSREQWT